jgi:aminoglycoside phosphotransferase (APT) family kinase protein|tara:strand:- start:1460 stop:1798 length:339 start_codon:yes stop_codon:yes gene_type:complete
MKREYRALSKLCDQFRLAPRSFLYCDDDSIIGAPFQIMERRHGLVIREMSTRRLVNTLAQICATVISTTTSLNASGIRAHLMHEPAGAPATRRMKTFPARIQNGVVQINLGS